MSKICQTDERKPRIKAINRNPLAAKLRQKKAESLVKLGKQQKSYHV